MGDIYKYISYSMLVSLKKWNSGTAPDYSIDNLLRELSKINLTKTDRYSLLPVRWHAENRETSGDRM